MTDIAISRIHFPVTTLGPGRRVCIWFQGCSIRCQGCISADTWAVRAASRTVEDVLDGIAGWLSDADGVTITGGEPLDQPKALKSLLTGLRQQFVGDILLFTGLDGEAAKHGLQELEGLVDAAIIGPYDASSGQTKALRGSDNQWLSMLTPQGQVVFSDTDNAPPSRRLDMMLGADDQVYFAGIPAPGDFEALKLSLEEAGHIFTTSEDRRKVAR